ncbi:MAG: (2Fe-2S)-binding protein [Selenomonadales bacterium]|nr:(2Fe-2S)-binding protein [Selenomonadales bacterium]
MRIAEHPILNFKRGKQIKFIYEGQELTGHEGETIAAALHAAGVKVLSRSAVLHRPRGFFCAIGTCSSCLMMVDGVPNVRVCVTKLKAGMVVKEQQGRGTLA